MIAENTGGYYIYDFTENNGDTIATIFDLKNKHLFLKSYLLNNKKNLDILTYYKLINEANNNEDYFTYSLLHSIILKDLNNALELNLNLSDLLFTSILKIIKINKNILKV